MTQGWIGWLGDVAKGIGDRGRDRRRRRRAARVRDAPLRPPLVGAGGRARGRLRRAHDLREPDRARPAVQQVRAAAGRGAALRRARAGGRGRRGGRRGLRDGRLAPHDRGQRLRGGPRLDQARGALRQPAERLHGGRGAAGGRPRARARALPRTSRAGCSTWRSWRRSGCSRSPGWPSGWRRRGAAGRGPGGGAGAGAARAGDHDRSRTSSRGGRGARRPLLDRAHRTPRTR